MGAEGNLQLDLHMEVQSGAWQIRVIGILIKHTSIMHGFLYARFLLCEREHLFLDRKQSRNYSYGSGIV